MCFVGLRPLIAGVFFFFNDTATTEIYTLSLHDALPIYAGIVRRGAANHVDSNIRAPEVRRGEEALRDRKSTRLNSSHGYISYAVFCLKKKKTDQRTAVDPFTFTSLRLSRQTSTLHVLRH